MSKDKDHEEKRLVDTSGEEQMQFVRDNRRVDTAQAILEFGEFVINAAKEMSQDDQGRARPRY